MPRKKCDGCVEKMQGGKAAGGAWRCGSGRWLRRRGPGSRLGGCVVSERVCSPPGAGALRLSSHPGARGPTQPLGPLPLLSLPASVVRSDQIRGRQQNHGALGAFPHRRPRTSRRLHSGALGGCSGDRPPCGHGCGRWGGRPTEHVESLCICEGAIPVAQCPAHSGLASAFLARGGTNAGRRVPARLREVCSGET